MLTITEAAEATITGMLADPECTRDQDRKYLDFDALHAQMFPDKDLSVIDEWAEDFTFQVTKALESDPRIHTIRGPFFIGWGLA